MKLSSGNCSGRAAPKKSLKILRKRYVRLLRVCVGVAGGRGRLRRWNNSCSAGVKSPTDFIIL